MEETSSRRSYSKAYIALALSLGNFAPYTVLMVYSTQLYKQLDFDNLGFYILAITSFSGALMCLLSPGIVLSINSKRSIIISSFGITLGFILTVGYGYVVTFFLSSVKILKTSVTAYAINFSLSSSSSS